MEKNTATNNTATTGATMHDLDTLRKIRRSTNLSTKFLAIEFKTTTTKMSGILSKLERKGLLRGVTDKCCKRPQRYWFLTADAKAALR